MSVVIYSFLRGGRKERLREHVMRALETFSEGSRLVRFGSELSKNFYLMLRYSIILHDFGKVLFNQLFLPAGAQEISFEGHEILSAWFADKYLGHLVTDGLISQDERAVIVLSILFHHHPMNLQRRANRLKEVLNRRVRGLGRSALINEETLKLFYAELSNIIEPLPISVNAAATEALSETVGCELPSGRRRGGLIREYWSSIWMNGTPNKRKSFLLLTQGLIAADYHSASQTRGEGTSKFAKTISTYLKYWT